MVGGGQGAFIGAVHRIASRLDGDWELVAGALSSDPARASASAVELGLDPDRSYSDFRRMATAEARRSDGIDAVSIVTPNHLHAGPAIAFLEAGIHVICDKPLSATLDDAKAVVAAVEASGKTFILTHNYTAYPMIRQARDMVAKGDLGRIRVIQAEYAQDWLTEPGRTDPARSGAGGCVGDIGTHAFNLACFVTGLRPVSVAADLDSFVEGRRLDDNVQVLLRFDGGAKGMLWASQVAVGNENGMRLRVFGEIGGLEWCQENPNLMTYTRFGNPKQLLTRAGAGATEPANAVSRIPGGHPEGYLEGFATVYREAAALIRSGENVSGSLLPTVSDGLAGMEFIEACVESSSSNSAWVWLNS
ncbi:MAG: Gfo/Idh/MocA family oxidoreductase [Rhodobacteraceae bacterium]|nr:Gfo/Idh/MocA family oxidoreductase [Paracoccaceae bacterium]